MAAVNFTIRKSTEWPSPPFGDHPPHQPTATVVMNLSFGFLWTLCTNNRLLIYKYTLRKLAICAWPSLRPSFFQVFLRLLLDFSRFSNCVAYKKITTRFTANTHTLALTHTHTHIRTPARWVKERYDKTKEMAERWRRVFSFRTMASWRPTIDCTYTGPMHRRVWPKGSQFARTHHRHSSPLFNRYFSRWVEKNKTRTLAVREHRCHHRYPDTSGTSITHCTQKRVFADLAETSAWHIAYTNLVLQRVRPCPTTQNYTKE